MAVVQIADVIVPQEFTEYTIQNTMVKSALFQSGVAARNGVIDDQLTAGAESFNVPFWYDLADSEADICSDDPSVNATPDKLSAGKQIVRKSFLHKSWSTMSLASELAGSDAMVRIQDRVAAYWTRQMQKRLIASLNGILADNVANDGGDMVVDISAETGGADLFGAAAVIDTAATLGDAMTDLSAIAMHSDVYALALKNNLVDTFVLQSDGSFIQRFRGLNIIVDDGMPVSAGVYTSVLFGAGAVGYGVAAPRIAAGTEIHNLPEAGNGGGQQILHSRVNLAIHPAGYAWKEATIAADSPSLAELALPANWSRVVERKAVPLAFLKHKVA
ncbi:major capsid protein [Rhodanobacter sp. Si-c]|uniref:Major capsid protein n=1 Tax=Rhodanobacter lycopersici TaxID=3162487 RepID=A0ABV3QAL5_9GAMM